MRTIFWAVLCCACGLEEGQEEPAAGASASSPTSTGLTVSTPPLGDTATTTDTGRVSTDTAGVDTAVSSCDAVTIGPPTLSPVGTDPMPFAPRADGTFWFAPGAGAGVWMGGAPGTAALVHVEGAEHVTEDPYGVLHFQGDGALYRVSPGGAVETVALGLYYGTAWSTDLEAHPSGAVAFTWHGSGSSLSEVVVVDALGGVTTLAFDGVSEGISALSVAWSADFTTMWLLASDTLWRMDVDGQGIPDRSTLRVEPTPPFLATWGSDLAVDACDNIYLFANLGFGTGAVFRYDPATGISQRLEGNVDQGYGGAPLRFGTAPGTEHHLATMSGGWSTVRQDWIGWDVGVGAPAWP